MNAFIDSAVAGMLSGGFITFFGVVAYWKGWRDRGEQDATFAHIDELKRIEQEHQQCLAKQETPK